MYTTKEELENLRKWVYDKGYEHGIRNGLLFAFGVMVIAVVAVYLINKI